MSKLIIVGDIHLGKSLTTLGKPGVGSQLNSRLVDQLTVLEWVLEQAIDQQVSDIIATGDIWEDFKPHPAVIALFIDWLKKCSTNGISVHLIQGNHDIMRSGIFNLSALDIIISSDLDKVFVYKDLASIELPGVSFTFIPFRDRRSFNTNSNSEALKLLSTKIRYENIGLDKNTLKIVVGHLALEGSIHIGDEIDDFTNELWCPLEMFSKYDYTFMGHIHKPQILSRSPYISHIGSMDLSNFSESNHSKVIAIIDPDSNPVMRYLEVPSRPLKSVSVSVPADTTNTTEYVINQLNQQNPNLSKAIVKAHIAFESPELMNVDRVAVENCLTKMGAFYVPRIDQERKISQVKKTTAQESIDNTVNEAMAIKMYASSNVEKNLQDDFITLANVIVKETNATN